MEGLVTVEEDVIGARDTENDEIKKGRKKTSIGKGKGKETKETDQEFLMKYGTSREILFFWIINHISFLVTFSTVAGSTAPQSTFRHIGKLPVPRS